MKLATYQTADGPRLGIVLPEQGQIVNAAAACTRLLELASPRAVQHAGADRKR